MTAFHSAEFNLGPCCCCGKEGPEVQVVVTLDFHAPVSGTGWGCVLCGLPCDGAVAVLCHDCAGKVDSHQAAIQTICVGYPSEGRRAAWPDREYPPFGHILSKHGEVLH